MNAILWNSARRVLALCGLALVLGVAPVSSAKAATLQLVRLRCYDTQDVFCSIDECRLKVSGGWKAHFDRVMLEGETWEIAAEHEIQAPVTVRLFDRDRGGAADLLGEVIIPAAPTNGFQTALFNQQGALYKLVYRVLP